MATITDEFMQQMLSTSSLSERTEGQSCQPLRQRMCCSRHGHKRQNGMRSQAEEGQRW